MLHMQNQAFQHQIEKDLWYLNQREKKALHTYLKSRDMDDIQNKYRTPQRFVSYYLKNHIFSNELKTSSYLTMTLIGLFVVNVMLLGLFIGALLLCLSSAHYFIQPNMNLSVGLVIAIMLTALISLVLIVYLMKVANGYFTKRLIDYKFNKAK